MGKETAEIQGTQTQLTRYQDIYDYVMEQEKLYQRPITVIEGYPWNMKTHIRTTVLYKNGQLLTGKTDDKPIKNIILPILRLQYVAEGFHVKDIDIYADNDEEYYKSFLIKKFHDDWARKNHIDDFIDELVEGYIDFGGSLVKKTKEVVPQVTRLESIVFADQTDLLSGPIGIKHYYSPSELKEMEGLGWGNPSNGATATLDEVITLSEAYKVTDHLYVQQNQTPGKYIEVYEIHGTLPKYFLTGNLDDINVYVPQLQIITFYTTTDRKKHGLTLFKGVEKDNKFKLILRDKIFNRALGMGGVEELAEAQIWTTYNIMRIQGLLDAASKIIYQTSDEAFRNRNRTSEVDNGEILITADGKTIAPINTTPSVNVSLFERSLADWEGYAQQIGGASNALRQNTAMSGVAFRLQELVMLTAQRQHDYRKGKIATFVEQIYREWIIPELAKELKKGKKWLAELSLEELQQVADSFVICEMNEWVKDKILNGEIIEQQDIEKAKDESRKKFMKGGNKKFMEILKDEMSDIPLQVKVSIVGKQKDLAGLSDKLWNMLRQLVIAPQILDDQRFVKIYNQLLESSGLDPIDYYEKPPQQPQMMNPQGNLPPPQNTNPTSASIASQLGMQTPNQVFSQLAK